MLLLVILFLEAKILAFVVQIWFLLLFEELDLIIAAKPEWASFVRWTCVVARPIAASAFESLETVLSFLGFEGYFVVFEVFLLF